MTFQQEARSSLSPPALATPTRASPGIGEKAPAAPQLPQLQLQELDGKATIITFLRHCGCPFAEKTFLNLRKTATQYPDLRGRYIAVSHSDKAPTDQWLSALGGSGGVEIVVDEQRELFALWGLGVAGFWHVLNPTVFWSVYQLGKGEGIWHRPTESGSRWQTAGSFVVDKSGVVRWGGAATRADEIPTFEDAVNAVV